MSRTLSIRLADDIAEWLRRTSKITGISQARIIQDQLEKAREAGRNKEFMKYAGYIKGGPRDVSSRKGFSRS